MNKRYGSNHGDIILQYILVKTTGLAIFYPGSL